MVFVEGVADGEMDGLEDDDKARLLLIGIVGGAADGANERLS